MVRYSLGVLDDSSPERSATSAASDAAAASTLVVPSTEVVLAPNGFSSASHVPPGREQDAVRRAVAEFQRKLAESDAANDAANNRKKEQDRQRLLEELNSSLASSLYIGENNDRVMVPSTNYQRKTRINDSTPLDFMLEACEKLRMTSEEEIDKRSTEDLRKFVSACTKKRLWDSDVCPEFFATRARSSLRMLVTQTPTELKKYYLKLLFFGSADDLMKHAALLDHLENTGLLLRANQKPTSVTQWNEWFDVHKENVQDLQQEKRRKHRAKTSPMEQRT